MAERVGFEPTVELPRQQFSRLPDSAALAPLRFVDARLVGHRKSETSGVNERRAAYLDH
jgi:hypothetical protein